MNPVHAIAIFIVASILAFACWQVVNSRMASKSRRSRQRTSDRIKLSKQQKKIYNEAISNFKAGNLKSSARMLASLNMHREAINILEKGNYIHEAAKMLLSMHRPNRAGMMFARNGMHKEAMECFKQANMPRDFAESAKQLGDIATAVVYFKEAKMYQEAAESYEELGKHKEAAKLYTKTQKPDKAIQQYIFMLDKNPDVESVDFKDEEIELIIDYMIKNEADPRLARVIAARSRLASIIVPLIKSNEVDRATEIYIKISADIGPELIAREDLSHEENSRLADLFQRSSAYEYAGMIYERQEDFKSAANAFRLQEDFERAAYCYERAQMPKMVTEMRIEMASRGTNAKSSRPIPKIEPKPPASNISQKLEDKEGDNPFAIESVSTEFYDTPTGEVSTQEPMQKTESPNPGVNLSKPIVPSFNLGEDDEATDPGNKPSAQGNFELVDPNIDYSTIDWSGLHDANFLQDLTTEQQKLFRDVGRVKKFEAEDVILDYQEEPIGIYFILEGMVRVHRMSNGVDTPIDSMKAPETIGKLWLFMDRPTEVKFVANEASVLFAIKRGDFMDVLDKNGTIARKVYKRITTSLIDKIVSTENKKEKLEAS